MNIHHTTYPDSRCTSFNEWMDHIQFQLFLIRNRERIAQQVQFDINNLAK
jgi:hypothetical protein